MTYYIIISIILILFIHYFYNYIIKNILKKPNKIKKTNIEEKYKKIINDITNIKSKYITREEKKLMENELKKMVHNM